MKRWVVGPLDGETVGAIVERLLEKPSAIVEGRVFVGPHRARNASDPVRPGDEVRVTNAPEASGGAIVILANEAERVAAFKPAGMPTIADHGGAAHCLVARVADQLGVAEYRVHTSSRLDRDVSGVVLLSLSKPAREALVHAREQHRYIRRYVALAAGDVTPDAGTWDAPIGRAQDPRHRAAFGPAAAAAKTHYAVVAKASGVSLLALSPVTGRTHQLRVHAAHAGAPLVGDRVYGGAPRPLVLPNGRVLPVNRIALHAARVTILASAGAVRRGQLARSYDAPIPPELAELFGQLGGEATAWEKAVSWELPYT